MNHLVTISLGGLYLDLLLLFVTFVLMLVGAIKVAIWWFQGSEDVQAITSRLLKLSQSPFAMPNSSATTSAEPAAPPCPGGRALQPETIKGVRAWANDFAHTDEDLMNVCLLLAPMFDGTCSAEEIRNTARLYITYRRDREDKTL